MKAIKWQKKKLFKEKKKQKEKRESANVIHFAAHSTMTPG